MMGSLFICLTHMCNLPILIKILTRIPLKQKAYFGEFQAVADEGQAITGEVQAVADRVKAVTNDLQGVADRLQAVINDL